MSIINIPCCVRGRFKLQVFKLDDSGNELYRRDVAEFDNLITNYGLDAFGSTSFMPVCGVGTGNTAPAVGNITLQSQSMLSTSTLNLTNAVNASSPYETTGSTTYRFPAAASNINIAEVGVGINNAGALNCFSRELIRDGLGNPTTISLLTNEILDVTYQLKYYPPLADVTGTITLGGSNYSYTVRAARCGAGPNTGDTWTAFTTNNAGAPRWLTEFGATDICKAYDGAIGAITGLPSGTAYNVGASSDCTVLAYTNGNYYRDFQFIFTLARGNAVGGIEAILCCTNRGIFQIGFSPAIPKNSTNQLTLVMRIAWSRV